MKPQDRLMAIVGIVLVFLAASLIVGTDNVGLVVRGAVRTATVEEVSIITGMGSDTTATTGSTGSGVGSTAVSSSSSTASSAATARPSQTTTASAQTTIPMVEVEEEVIEIPDYVNAPSVKRYAIMSVSAQTMEQASYTLTLPLPGGSKTFDLEADDIVYDGTHAGDFTWTGKIVNNELSNAVVVHRNGLFAGTFTTAQAGADGIFYTYTIMPLSPGKGIVLESDVESIPFLDGVIDSETGKPVGEVDVVEATQTGEMTAEEKNTLQLAGAPYTVDLLVVYTNLAMKYYGPTSDYIETIIAMWGAYANHALANSQAPLQFRIVHAHLTPDKESKGVQTNLELLSDPSDGHFDEVDAIRKHYGADFVTMITHRKNGGWVCGVAYMPTGSTLPLYLYWTSFSVVDTSQSCGDPSVTPILFAHELGHNLGMAHDEPNTSVHGAYTDMYGYKRKTPPAFRTLMSYYCNSVPCPWINYFSSDITQATVNGITVTVGDNDADNAGHFNSWAKGGIPLVTMKWGDKLTTILPTSSNQPSAPFPPVNVKASDGTVFNQIDVSWDDASNTTTYLIYRKDTSTGTWVKQGSTKTLYFSDTSASINGVHEYYVIGQNAGGYSNPSASDTGFHLSPNAPPLPPSDVYGGLVSSYLNVSWEKSPNSNVTGYEIYLATGDDVLGCQLINYITTVGNQSQTQIGPIPTNNAYTLSILAVNPAGKSSCVVGLVGPDVPVINYTTNTGDDIYVNVTAPQGASYVYYRGDEPDLPLDQMSRKIYSTTNPSFTDYGFDNYGHSYFYRVAVISASGVESKASNEVSGIAYPAPANLSYAPTAPGKILVDWVWDPDPGTMPNLGFVVYRTDEMQNKGPCEGDRFIAGKTKYVDKSVVPGTKYMYSVRAYNEFGLGLCEDKGYWVQAT